MRWKLLAGLVLAGVAVWAAVDLWGPRHSDLRKFDAHVVARIETDMWRSYYDKRKFDLFRGMTELMRLQYGFPWLRSQLAAYHGARAAFEFKKGSNRTEYEQALRDLRPFYASVRKVSNIPFDVEKAAKLELEWWIIHRQRDREALIRSLAELQACLYQMPVEAFREHAVARADAMLLRDREAAPSGAVPEKQWAEIGALLDRSWTSLSQAVTGQRQPEAALIRP